jgi:hypothetical protein
VFIKEKLMIEKILNEIHRLKEELDDYSALEGLDYIESYINTLQQSLPSALEVKEVQEEPVSDDLHAVAKEYADNITDKIGYNLQLRRAVVYGAKWKEKQIIKDAIDGKVIANGMGSPILHLWDKGREFIGDKVKVIIIKSE